MKKRLVSAVMAAALAIIPFTGTGIKAVDKVIVPETTITASANTGLTRVFDRLEFGPTGWNGKCSGYAIYKVYLNGKYQGEISEYIGEFKSSGWI